MREATRNYLEIEDALRRLDEEKKRLEQQRTVYQTAIHMCMRQLDIDEINVRNIKFSRVVKAGKQPRRAQLKDPQLVDVLKKHLAGEDGKLRSVLEDIAQMRAPPAAQTTTEAHEVLVRRTVKRG